MLLARALLALACAAPLLASPVHNHLDAAKCTSKLIGVQTNVKLEEPVAVIPAGVKIAEVDIPNNCVRQGRTLAGEVIKACDSDVTPVIQAEGFSPVYIIRMGSYNTIASVYVDQYCY